MLKDKTKKKNRLKKGKEAENDEEEGMKKRTRMERKLGQKSREKK